MVIAIDGPTASGKGTVAKLLAKTLNFLCLDTGAVYRGITVFFLNTEPADDAEFEKKLKAAKIEIKCGADKKTLVYLDGKDITDEIRTVKVGKTVPLLALKKFVQDRVRKIQYETAKNLDLVVEGRETTSVAFPNAEHKFYLNATLQERARRRQSELKTKGEDLTFEEVYKQTEERDRLDMTRELSPLVKVPEAIEVDTTGRNPNEVVDEMLGYILHC